MKLWYHIDTRVRPFSDIDALARVA